MSLFPLSPAHQQTLHQFFRFSVIGTGGVLVDSSVLYGAMHGLGLNHYTGRLLSWLVAASFTWVMNRRFTFADSRPPLIQWAKFLAAASVGGIVNYAVYALLVAFNTTVAIYPFIGVGAGSIAGLAFNFSASKWVIFRVGTGHENPG